MGDPAGPEIGDGGRLRALVLLGATLVGLWLCFRLTVPFLPALTWALALAILFVPAHRWIEARLKGPNLAATASVVLVTAMVGAPLVLLGDRLFEEAAGNATSLQAKLNSAEWRQTLQENRIAATALQVFDRLAPADTVGRMATWAANAGAALIRERVTDVITLLMTFYLLFYFLRDREVAVRAVRAVLPLSHDEMDRLFRRVADTVHATLYGTVAVAVVQGALGGAMFWWLGLPAPLLWGLVMGVLAIIPVLGAFVVWVPAAAVLALDGEWGRAVILSLWGLVVIGGIDNLLYPVLVGDRMRLHTVPAFIAVVGGLILFGPSGLLLGPLTVTTTLFALEVWRTQLRRPRQRLVSW